LSTRISVANSISLDPFWPSISCHSPYRINALHTTIPTKNSTHNTSESIQHAHRNNHPTTTRNRINSHKATQKQSRSKRSGTSQSNRSLNARNQEPHQKPIAQCIRTLVRIATTTPRRPPTSPHTVASQIPHLSPHCKNKITCFSRSFVWFARLFSNNRKLSLAS
jgi:macrodomain Ter protein organizer (MatP/YcbG family)